MGRDDGFEASLARLREAREEVEQRLLERVEDLARRVAAARAAADGAEGMARAEAHTPAPTGTTEPEGPPLPGRPEQPPWPAATGWRRLFQRPLRWLLHDYLDVLDRRHEALARAIEERDRLAREALAGWHEADRRRAVAWAAALESGLAGQQARTEAVRELATRTVEALDRVADVILHTRELLNAKEAETVQVATEGVRARSEVLLDELTRQQEALLAELVGRREEIDALVAELRRDSETDG